MREAECLVEAGLELLSARIKSVDRQGKNQERSERFKSASERRRANKKSGYRSYRSRRRRWKGDMNGKSGNPLDLATLPSPLLLLFASVLILSFSASTFPFFPYLPPSIFASFFFLSFFLSLLLLATPLDPFNLSIFHFTSALLFPFLFLFLSRLYISSPRRAAIHPSLSESLFSLLLPSFSFFFFCFILLSLHPRQFPFSSLVSSSPFFFFFLTSTRSQHIFPVFPVLSPPLPSLHFLEASRRRSDIVGVL